MRAWLLSVLLVAPSSASAASLDLLDGVAFCPFAPSLELHPTLADRALAACGLLPSVFTVAIPADAAPSAAGPNYFMPGSLDCSESGDTAPSVANLYVAGASRAWLVTSVCDLVVPFDPSTGTGIEVRYQGTLRDEVPTRRTVAGAFTTYRDGAPGAAIASFETDFTSAVVRAGDRLLVATSNFSPGGTGSNPELDPGTVLLFDIDDSGPEMTVDPASPPYLITSDPNPTALTLLPNGLVLVTNTGLLDAAFPPLVTGDGSIDIIDPGAGALLGSVPLGPNPGGRTIAVDVNESVAVATSHTRTALFAIDIRGLAQLRDPGVDPTLQRPSCNDVPGETAGGLPCLRDLAIHGSANPLSLVPGGPATDGFIPEVRFGASGDFLVATSFNDGNLAMLAFDPQNLDLPHPLLPSRFGEVEIDVATGPPGFGIECCPGPMVLHDDSAAGFDGSHVFFLSASPNGVLVRGKLVGSLAPAEDDDFDMDGVEDAVDNCPVTANGMQLDAGSVGAGPPDQIGDVCQCGDVGGDGRVTGSDHDDVRGTLTDPDVPLAFPDKCDVTGDGACTVLDALGIARALDGRSPGLVQGCAPAVL